MPAVEAGGRAGKNGCDAESNVSECDLRHNDILRNADQFP